MEEGGCLDSGVTASTVGRWRQGGMGLFDVGLNSTVSVSQNNQLGVRQRQLMIDPTAPQPEPMVEHQGHGVEGQEAYRGTPEGWWFCENRRISQGRVQSQRRWIGSC